MRRLVRLRPMARCALVLFLLAPTLALAAEPAMRADTGTGARTASTPRFTVKASSTEAAPQRSSRYTLRARFAPVESAGELREGANFSLIGRFAKGGVSCGIGGVIFSNGFEGT